MKSEFLKDYPHIYLNVLALILFLGTFVAVLINVYRKTSQENFKTMSMLPFEKGESNE